MKKILLVTIIALLFFIPCIGAEELQQISAAIHLASTVSDGVYSLGQLADYAQGSGIRVVAFTDRDMRKWEYGLFPLRKLVKKTLEHKSILRFGAGRYLEEIASVQAAHPDMAFLAGVESAPFYFWEGNPAMRTLTMRYAHKHLLVIGLEKADDLRNLPVAGNWNALLLPLALSGLLRIASVIGLIVAGVHFLFKRRYRYHDAQGNPLGPFSRGWQLTGACCITAGILFFMDAFPFRRYVFDQYGGDKGLAPYQRLIVYASKRGALTFWAHPEEPYSDIYKGVRVETPAYYDDLRRSWDYTGFEVFYGGENRVGVVGGVWDALLLEYCAGKRSRAVWAIGGLGLERERDPSKAFLECRTVLLVPSFEKEKMMEALASGRMYAVKGSRSGAFTLSRFVLRTAKENAIAFMGGELIADQPPLVEIAGSLAGAREGERFTVTLIKNGKVEKTFLVSSPFDLVYQDRGEPAGSRSYYRLEVAASGVHAVANPVFVQYG